jgi:ABC-type multidrug transport system ATPase subunit
MLILENISLETGDGGSCQTLLREISIRVREGRFTAIVGPSGCGKTTLIKTIAGILEPNEGEVRWEGGGGEGRDLLPFDIGYVPQFNIAYDSMTVWENVATALRLRIGGMTRLQRERRVEQVLEEVGLAALSHQRTGVLSGGEKRRLCLAMEVVGQPQLFLCDEATSGLDPHAEEEITRVIRKLSSHGRRIVLAVTHSLRHLELYDRVIVLHEGALVFHGPSHLLSHYFHLQHPEQVFRRLSERATEEWQNSWRKHRHDYETEGEADSHTVGISVEPGQEKEARTDQSTLPVPGEEKMPPNAWVQFATLTKRRWQTFFRTPGQLALQAALILGFPLLVVVFAYQGLPAVRNLTATIDFTGLAQLQEVNQFMVQSSRTGTLVSGLVMFQVILLALMGSNNSAREIAVERPIFEKEKFAGLNPLSYVASKVGFFVALVAVQSVWMALFVKLICGFPGDLLQQVVLLVAVNGAMTATALAISSLAGSPENATLISVYLVGFQLPLSGAILFLPSWLGPLVRPFVAAYWGWSGLLETMKDTRLYDVALSITETPLAHIPLCWWALASHVVVAVFLALAGCQRNRWEQKT